MANTTVDFNVPSPYQTEQRRIQQQQKMAEMLQAQSMQPNERFSYNGIEARTPVTAGLAKMLQGFTGMMMQKKGLEEEKALGEKYQAQSAGEARDFLSALRGTPAVPEKAMPQTSFVPSGSDLTDVNVPRVPEGYENTGNIIQRAYTVPAVAGVPADRGKALGLAMQSINPMIQSAGGALLAAEMPKATKWEKAELPEVGGAIKTGWVDINAPDPVKTFISGGKKPAEVTYVDVGSGIQPTNKATGLPLANAPVIPKNVSTDTQARLTQEKALSDRAFNNLSAAQQETQKAEAKRFGLSIQEYNLRKWQAENPVSSFHEGENGPVAFNPRTNIAAPVMTAEGKPLAGGKALTESQGNATAYGMRMQSANDILEKLAKETDSFGQNIVRPPVIAGVPYIGESLAQNLPSFLGGSSGKQQQVQQAKTNFITAVLRKESGAAIGPIEFITEDKKYFPQPNDSQDVIKQKEDARKLAIQAMSIQAGPGAKNIAPTTGVWAVVK